MYLFPSTQAAQAVADVLNAQATHAPAYPHTLKRDGVYGNEGEIVLMRRDPAGMPGPLWLPQRTRAKILIGDAQRKRRERRAAE